MSSTRANRGAMRWIGAGLATAGVAAMAAWSPDDATAQAPPALLQAMQAESRETGEAEPARRFPKFEEVIKDMQAMEGLFTLYRYDPADKERDPERLLCRIPAGLLDQDLLFATSISRGGFFTGWMWDDYLIRWEVVGDHIKLVTPDTNYATPDSPITDAVRRTYNERYLASMPIVTIAPGGDVVFELDKLLKTNVADVAFMGGQVRPELSKWHSVKVFPDNLLIDVDLALAQRQGGSRLGVAYAFRRLPELGSYSPRKADDRVGYFLTARVDWSREHTARDTFDRLINRWQLEKRDPSLTLSPPKKPITFIIEKTVPVRWRRWVQEGILDWNKAFEKIGFVNAIVVQQQTDDNEYADYDPEDSRYNFFRWIVTGSAFAMGPSRVDPRTGQILDADIIMDDSFVRVWMQEFDIFAPATVAQLKSPGFANWVEQHPDAAAGLFRGRFSPSADPDHELLEAARARLEARGRHVCNYAVGFRQQMAFVHSAMLATGSGKELPEHFIGEAIREVVAHEVGHALGLRHNFKASSWLSLDEIQRRRDHTDEPTSASVMDYNPLLFFPGDKADSVRHFVTPVIGPYDYWAIEYGYGLPAKGQSEDELLKQITARCTQPELAYGTDEDTMWTYSPDPATNRYDMGDNPAKWARTRLELAEKLTDGLLDWSIRDGEPLYFARRAFDTLWFEKARNFEYLGRMIGGQHFNREYKGDPGARPALQPLSGAQQREALNILCDTLFNDEFFQMDPELLNNLPAHRWWHFGMRPAMRIDYPVHDRISLLQTWTLVDILSPPVLQRIYDTELKTTESDKLTAAEYIRALRDGVFRQLDQAPGGGYDDNRPYISSIARGLQREYLDMMLWYARSTPGMLVSPDLDAMIRFALRQLSDRMGAVIEQSGGSGAQSKLDFASLAHLVESKSRIDRALEAPFSGR